MLLNSLRIFLAFRPVAIMIKLGVAIPIIKVEMVHDRKVFKSMGAIVIYS